MRPLSPLPTREEISRMNRAQLEHLHMELAIDRCRLEQRVNELEAAAQQRAQQPASDRNEGGQKPKR